MVPGKGNAVMSNAVRRVAGHGGALVAVGLLSGVVPHGAAATVLSVLYLVGYLVPWAGRGLLGMVRWARTLMSELLEFLSMAAKLPAAWREFRANWRRGRHCSSEA
jgi:hypothetical protein